MALNTLSLTVTNGRSWTATDLTSGQAQPSKNVNQPSRAPVFGTQVANKLPLGADLLSVLLLNFGPTQADVALIDLTNTVDIMGFVANYKRVKYLRVDLVGSLETDDDGATLGYACTSISVGGGSTPFPIYGVTTPLVLQGGQQGSSLEWMDRGSFQGGGAGGVVITSANKLLKILNNDTTGLDALVQISICGGSS